MKHAFDESNYVLFFNDVLQGAFILNLNVGLRFKIVSRAAFFINFSALFRTAPLGIELCDKRTSLIFAVLCVFACLFKQGQGLDRSMAFWH